MAAAKDQDIVDRLTNIIEDAPYGPWMQVNPTRWLSGTSKGHTPTEQHQKERISSVTPPSKQAPKHATKQKSMTPQVNGLILQEWWQIMRPNQ